jgi:preprotein translocase subunit SecF
MGFKSILFVVLIFLIVLKYTQVWDINIFLIIGVFCIWFASIYISVHLKNKDRNTPRPVYTVGG